MVIALLRAVLLVTTLASVDTCKEALAADLNQTIPILMGKTHDPEAIKALERFTFTGKSYNDLGHYDTCIRTPESSYYLLRQRVDRLSLLLGVYFKGNLYAISHFLAILVLFWCLRP
jgi:hypothetical protein